MGNPIPLTKPRSRCRKWRLQVSKGRDKLTGKYTKVSKVFEGSERQAKRALLEYENEIANAPCQNGQMTFGDFAEKWLDSRSKHIRKGTLRKNIGQVRNLHLYMSNTRLCDIDEEVVLQVLEKLATEGGMSGKPLSGSTCQSIFFTLGLILEDARRKKLIASNPCKEVETRYRPKNDTKEKDTLTLDEARMLQSLLMDGEPTSHKMGVMLALNCGLGREEFTALQWCDVDLGTKCIKVEKANTADDSELMTTKNNYRRRIIPLTDEVTDRLADWKKVQASKLKGKGIATSKHTPVVSNPAGELIHPEAFGKWWRRYRKKIGLDEYGLHQLRHTYASILCAAGVDIITASKLMGHCDTTMLSRIYAHMIPEYARSAVDKVGSVLGGQQEISPVPFVIG